MEPVGQPVGPVVVLPDEPRLLGVEPPLDGSRARQVAHVSRGAEVIRVEVREEGRHDGRVESREDRCPGLLASGSPSPVSTSR